MLTNNVFFPSLAPTLSLSLPLTFSLLLSSADDKGRRLNELSVDEGLPLMSTRLSALAHDSNDWIIRCSIFRSLF